MGIRINTNVQSLVSQHRLEGSRNSLESAQTKLATGSRINKPQDDAAGLAISENLRAAMRATGQNIKNTQNGFFLMQTADGALNEITNAVIRMKELAVNASSDTNGDKERGYLDGEYQALKSEIDRISDTTLFNGRHLLNGEGGEVAIQVGARNSDALDRIKVSTNFDIKLDTLGLSDFDLNSNTSARETLEQTDSALETIAAVRGSIGAAESRLQTSVNNLQVYEENITGAFSQIRDADIAAVTSDYAKFNILTQSGVSVLSQANTAPQIALKLIG